MEKYGSNKIQRLMNLAQGRSISKKAEEERKIKELLELEANSSPCQSPFSDDCVLCILVRLPIRSLQRSICVSKLWYAMIHNPVFIHDHFLRSELVILFQSRPLKEKATDFSVESSVAEFPNLAISSLVNRPIIRPFLRETSSFFEETYVSKTCIQFMDYVDGDAVTRDFNISCLGKVIASCNGLILIKYNLMKDIGMIVMNPVTRKSVFLRLGTISPPNKESHGLMFDSSTNQYKVVHLFDDGSGYTSCEIMVVGERYWKVVDGPAFGLINWFGYRPILAIGALHWLPQKLHNDYIVSMEIGKESFKTIELPKTGGLHDRIAEFRDMLCFTSHEEMFKIEIWVLKSLSEGTWTRFHTIKTGCIMDMVPISGSRSGGQIIFTREEDASIYIYDFGLQAFFCVQMSKDVSSVKRSMSTAYLPHVNSLVSWSV